MHYGYSLWILEEFPLIGKIFEVSFSYVNELFIRVGEASKNSSCKG